MNFNFLKYFFSIGLNKILNLAGLWFACFFATVLIFCSDVTSVIIIDYTLVFLFFRGLFIIEFLGECNIQFYFGIKE